MFQVHNGSVKKAVVSQVSPVPLHMSSEKGQDSVHTQPSAADLSLLSAQAVPPPELSQVSWRVVELHCETHHSLMMVLMGNINIEMQYLC